MRQYTHKHYQISQILHSTHTHITFLILVKQIKKLQRKLDKIGDPGDKPDTFYDSKGDAYDHQDSVSRLADDLEKDLKNKNPHTEQIEELKSKIKLEKVKINEYISIEDVKENFKNYGIASKNCEKIFLNKCLHIPYKYNNVEKYKKIEINLCNKQKFKIKN